MRTRAGLHRLTAFADAVVAIAVTVLVLPLVDLTSHPHGDLGDLLQNHRDEIGAFALSFIVIARFWSVHHQMFETVVGYDAMILRLTLVWLFTIVFLPFPTELLATNTGRGVDALYIGTLFASSATLSVTSAWLARHPRLSHGEAEPKSGYAAWVSPGLLGVAWLVAVTLPALGLWGLSLLIATGPLEFALSRKRR